VIFPGFDKEMNGNMILKVNDNSKKSMNTVLVAALILIGVFAYIFMAGCRDDTIYEKAPGFVDGFVTDSISVQPIYQAWVSPDSLFDTLDVLTDSSGYYVIKPDFPGTHRLAYCGKAGYITRGKEYSVSSDDTTRMDFELVGESIGLPVNE
jgi:hypothetical protein